MLGLETEQRENQATEGETAQQEAPQPAQSVGALLKRERERLGLSLEQITEMTRMRRQVVLAIENEDWNSLAPSVFVRGFLRSYAKVLGVSQDTVIDLYGKRASPESPGLEPHPEPSKNHRRSVWLVLLIQAGISRHRKKRSGSGLRTLSAGCPGSAVGSCGRGVIETGTGSGAERKPGHPLRPTRR